MNSRRLILKAAFNIIPAMIFTAFMFPVNGFSQKQNAIGLFEEGKKAQGNEQFIEAIELYKSSLAINPRYGGPLAGLAECYYAIEEYDEALAYAGEAIKYDRNNLVLSTLEGTILSRLGSFDKARERFDYVLKKEPNNLKARFGLAELDMQEGKPLGAIKKYMETLDVAPLNKDALLALVRIYSSNGDRDSALTYLELATKYFSNDPEVHYEAGRHYETSGDTKLAQFHYSAAMDLKPLNYRAILASSELYYKQGKTGEALALAKKALGSPSSEVKYRGRYLLGIFYGASGNIGDSVKNFIASLRIRNDDEVSRIAAETLAVSRMQETDPLRRELALLHQRNGKLYEKDVRLSMALNEYRRALVIDPHYTDARFSYGHVLKLQGYPINYLFNLALLKDFYGSKDPLVLDEYEDALKKYEASLSREWESRLLEATGTEGSVSINGIDGKGLSGNERKLFNQYTIAKKQFAFEIYTDPKKNGLMHLEADKLLVSYLRDLFGRSEKIAVKSALKEKDPLGNESCVASQASAFRKASESNTDYFIVCSFHELERSFEVKARVCLTRTGTEIKSFNVYRTGNNRVTSALVKCASDIEAALPIWGSIILREFNNAIIDMGAYQGVKPGDSLIILKKGSIAISNRDLALSYDDKDIIGELTVNRVDENISIGTIEKKGIYDFVNPQDNVIYAPEKNGPGNAQQ